MFEPAFGVVRDGEGDLDALRESLRWVDFLDRPVPDAIEAPIIQADRQAADDRTSIGDLLIAGVSRSRGVTLVAGDGYFQRTDGPAVTEGT